jgi:hypothetical protein
MKKICMGSAGALIAASLAVPASAATMTATTQAGGQDAHVIFVRDHHRRHHHRRHHGFEMRHGHPYYHGHRGYRHHRRGYREYNGFWFPPAAFVLGAIIGGAIGNAPSSGSAHVRWCEQHYRSYDVRTDTYQPYHGPRRRCVSPY